MSAKKITEYLLTVEVKSPRHHKNSVLDDDTVKIGNEMKDALDKMIDDGIESKDVTICGLLVQGFRCSMFIMDLRYDAIYRMVLLGCFYLPRDHYDFGVLLRAIEVLMQAQAIVVRTAKICVESIRSSPRCDVGRHEGSGESAGPVVHRLDAEIREKPLNEESPRTPPRRNMTRGSYFTPMKIRQSSSFVEGQN